MAEFQQTKPDYRHIVRIADTDLDGAKPIGHALNKIKGVSFMFANAVCIFSNVDKQKITGQLSADEIKRLNEVLRNPGKYGFPAWMLNRRKDSETGDDRHILGADLRWQVENDIKLMKKIRSYKGVRHMAGLPVRGQKTKNNFRKKKGKGLGVQRKKTAPAKSGGK
ncbi:30S ribosomal protein S13 [Candidatus Woesearchaeota archaeon]|nr:30S ribosomal protein S13 [Candidatus Woesearchaeota archaeon]